MAATLPGLTQALGRRERSVQSILRFAFILCLLWLLLTLAYGLSSSPRDELLETCLDVFQLGVREPSVLDHLLCNTYDFFDKWWWLLYCLVPPIAALGVTLAFRRSAA